MHTAFEIHTDIYSGPLAVLLDLIEKKKLSVSTLSLADITDDYISYIKSLPEVDIDELSQFILIAATLVLIKSKALIPTFELEEDERADVEVLEKRLLIFELIKGVAGSLKEEFKKQVCLSRRPIVRRKRVQFIPGSLSLEQVTAAAHTVLAQVPVETAVHETKVRKTISLEKVMSNIIERFTAARNIRFSEMSRMSGITEPKEVKTFMIVTFLAMLEIIRSGDFDVEQSGYYGEITMTKTN